MAEGIVTSSDREFRQLLERHSPEVAGIAKAARALIFEVMPDAVEVVWLVQGNSGYGIGPRKMSEQFAWIVPFAQHVALAFPFGAELTDPHGLLGGTGKSVRNVRLASPSDARAPELWLLVNSAIADLNGRRSVR